MKANQIVFISLFPDLTQNAASCLQAQLLKLFGRATALVFCLLAWILPPSLAKDSFNVLGKDESWSYRSEVRLRALRAILNFTPGT
jgi:hypothetical protein